MTASASAERVVVGRRRDRAPLDEAARAPRRDVLDVALAAVEGRDPVDVDVQQDGADAGLGEDLGERDADVAGADDGDFVRSSRLIVQSRSAILSEAGRRRRAAAARPWRGLAHGRDDRLGVATDQAVPPVSTVSTHSVVVRSVMQGTPYQYASFCTPPESVRTTRACEASAAKSR